MVAAAILVLAERFVRPVIVAFTGRLLLSTMGLFVVIVNALVIWVAPLVAPDVATVGPAADAVAPGLRRAVHGPHAALERGARPATAPSWASAGGTEAVWRVLESLPTPRRNLILENLRLQQIYDLVYAVALDSALRTRRPSGASDGGSARGSSASRSVIEAGTGPERFRLLLQQLGPTYVKIGQMIASRGDALPPDIIEELSKLQSDAAPFPWEDAREMIAGRAGQAARGAVRHDRATSRSRRRPRPRSTARRSMMARVVAVKVQRPRIVAKTKADLGVITRARGDRGASPGICARKVGLAAMVHEFAGGVLKELDYRNEAYHAKRLADNMARFPEITVPRIYDELSGTAGPDDGVHRAGSRSPRPRRCARPGSTPTRWAPCSSGRSSSRSSSTASSTATRTPATCWRTPRTSASCSSTSGLVGQLSATQRVDMLGLIYALK